MALSPQLPSGLSEAEAARRLRSDGPNRLPQPERRPPWRIVVDTLREPMFALLLAGGAIYLALGEFADAAVLMLFATLSVGIGVVQALRSERVLEALRELSSPLAVVIRGGARRLLPSAQLVTGDLILLAEGDRAPADALLLQGDDVQADESLITGESVAAAKAADQELGFHRPGDLAGASIYAGSLIVRGHGAARVVATGQATEMGRIGRALQTIQAEPTALTRQVRKVVRVLGMVAAALCVAVTLLLGLGQGAWLQGVLAGIALGMAMIPEEFPLVLTVFMVMGAWRISKLGVLTRQASAIETLGSATVLCTDKTGTLTVNRMSIAGGWRDGVFLGAEAKDAAALEPLIWLGALASAADPFDPMEKAFHAVPIKLRPPGDLVRTYGLRPGLMAVTQVWATGEPGERLIAAKGAPEAIAGLCGLDADTAAAVLQAANAMAERGMRVLGIAEGRYAGAALPDDPRAYDLQFRGLAGLADPLRSDVPAAITACHSAGIRVVMITGDYPATARAIADKAGLRAGGLVTGAEVAAMSDEALSRAVQTAVIFARILPEQKLRIVQALRRAGEVVAMTGDGVNDAPALTAADIGIAMGRRGSEVAREAADLVLLQDGFSAITDTIRTGRRIYDNLRNATGFILAVHVPIAGLALVPLLTGGGLILAPIHIAFLEMVIDPVCSIAFEAEEGAPDLMRRPPRPPGQPLFSRRRVLTSLAQGAIACLGVLAAYAYARLAGLPDAEIRTVAFTALVLIDVALIFANRAPRGSLVGSLAGRNLWLWSLAPGALCLLAVGLLFPPAREILQLGRLGPSGLSAVTAATLAAISLLLLLRVWEARRIDPGQGQRALAVG